MAQYGSDVNRLAIVSSVNNSEDFIVLYILITEIMFGTLAALIIYVVSTRYYQGSGIAYHSDPPEPSLLTEPYECINAQGDLRRCTKSKGPCYGKWKPPRTHHCSTCGVCRPGFDHHCPWLGACIKSSNMPAFLLILIITPVLFLAAVSPIIPILPARISHVFWVSRQTLWIREQWWDRWYSWVFIAGPPGRYMVGTLLGLKQMQDTECQGYECESPGTAIAKPGIRLILTIVFAVFLSIGTGIMAFATIRDITLGQTTLDTFRERGASGAERRGPSSFLCIPATSSLVERRVYEVLPGERLYDLGWRENWRRFFLHVKRNGIFGIDER
ncbi:PFA4_2 [Sanghuangporus weigelae]